MDVGEEMTKKKLAIHFNDVNFTYLGKKVIEDFNYRIYEKEFVALVGPFGSGKTTLLKLCNGSLKPQIGDVFLKGKSTNQYHARELSQITGFLHENPENQLFLDTVFDDIAFGPKNFGIPMGEINKRVISVSKKIGIADILDRQINSLSFGEKKLVALAGILITNPDFLLLDDPLLGLDFWTTDHLINLLTKLKKVTTIVCTANQWEILEIVDRILLIENGKFVEDFESMDEFHQYYLEKQRIFR